MIEEDQIDRLKRRGEADREQDIEQLILLAKACNTNDLDSIMAIYTALMSNNNVPFKEDGTIDHQCIYLFRAQPIRELPAGNPYIDGVIGNQVNASAIIFDMDRKCQRSAGLSNEKQNEHRGNSIHLQADPLPFGSINFVVDTSRTITIPYEGYLKRTIAVDQEEAKRISVTSHLQESSVNLRVTLAEVLAKQGKIYKDIRSTGTQATVSVEMPKNTALSYITFPSHIYISNNNSPCISGGAWNRLEEIMKQEYGYKVGAY